jgi:lipoprotein signal peptidase
MAWLELLTAVAVVLAADQLSKRHVLAEARFAAAGARRAYVSIRCIINRRLAVVHVSETWVVTAWIVCVALAFFLLDQEPFAENALGAAGIGMVLGGVTGNVIDLLWRRGIVDFIAFGSWTIFNLADVAIIGGLVLTVLALV